VTFTVAEIAVLAAIALAVLRTGRAPGRRLASSLLAGAIVVGTWPVLRSLRSDDLNWCYRYLGPDSYDWIANGLSWAGAPVAMSQRPPGLPLVIALLWRSGALTLLPLVNFLVVGVTTALLYGFLLRRHPPAVAATAAWLFYGNAYLQDLTRFVMAEIYATLFIVLAMRAFADAAEDPPRYRAFGAWLGVGFLFHYATLPAGVGFGVAILLTRRGDLRKRALWQGVAISAVLPGLWLIARWRHLATHPERHHAIEELVRFTLKNVPFYLVTGVALCGLALLPLYAAGALRLAVRPSVRRDAWRVAYLAPLFSLGVFFVLLYDWADKRFLVYLFPCAVCVLAEGLAVLAGFAARGPAPRAFAAAAVLLAIAWNQIQYPPYGIQYLAVTPRDFLNEAWRPAHTSLVHLHTSIPGGLRGGLFDFGLNPGACTDPSGLHDLAAEKPAIDRLLGPEDPVGLVCKVLPPVEYWVTVNRLGNVLLRCVVAPPQARLSISREPSLAVGMKELGASGTWHLLASAPSPAAH
jgi:hypothetical protein